MGMAILTSLTGDWSVDQRVIQELLQQLTTGLVNAHIAGSADIELSKLNFQDIGTLELSTTERVIPHTLGVIPLVVIPQPKANVTVYESSLRNKTQIYLSASGTANVRILVGA